MKYELRTATKQEADLCYEIIDGGRRFQREQGFIQWSDDYPNKQTIIDDIAQKKGYLLTADGEPTGYMYISFLPDEVYDEIDGCWNTPEKYAVMHRMAISSKFRGQGLTNVFFELFEEMCRKRGITAIRVDTDFPNKRMQHVFDKNGFTYCGTINFDGKKKAYDKNL